MAWVQTGWRLEPEVKVALDEWASEWGVRNKSARLNRMLRRFLERRGYRDEAVLRV